MGERQLVGDVRGTSLFVRTKSCPPPSLLRKSNHRCWVSISQILTEGGVEHCVEGDRRKAFGMATTSVSVPAAPTLEAGTLEELGPSPRQRYRARRLRHAAWDVFQALCVVAASLYLFARQRRPDLLLLGWSSAELRQVIWQEASADPLEASCACFTNFFLISMCGNSPLAWAVVLGFASVDNRMFDAFKADVVAHYGDFYDGNGAYFLGVCAFACFLLPYLVHGLLLLPLEVWSPAVKVGQLYKIQAAKRIDISRIPAVVAW